MFADLDAGKLGFEIGQSVPLILFGLGAVKCWSISKRPATNRKCALGLMFLLVSLSVSAVFSRLVRQFPEQRLWTGLLCMVALGFMAAAMTLAILGLIECRNAPGTYTQGRAQAIWTLVLFGILGVFVVAGFISANQRRLAVVQRFKPGQSIELTEFNMRFRAPLLPWRQMDVSRLNRHAKLGFIQAQPEIFFMIIPEKLSVTFSTEQLLEAAIARMESVAENARVIARSPQVLNGLRGIHTEVSGQISGYRFLYFNWVCVTNGWAYQLMCWGQETDRAQVSRAAEEMRKNFSIIDYERKAPRGGRTPQSDYELPRWGFTFHWKDSDWRSWENLAHNVPAATFGAEHVDDAVFLAAALGLGDLEAQPEVIYQGLLAAINDKVGSEPTFQRRDIEQAGLAGIEAAWKSRPQRADEFQYRVRILHGGRRAWLLAAWVKSDHPRGKEILDDAFARVEVKAPSETVDPSLFGAGEKRTHSLLLNSIGLVYFSNRQFERSAAFFRAALNYQVEGVDSPVLANLVEAWTAMGKYQESLNEIEKHPELLAAQRGLKMAQAFLQSRLGSSEVALANYERIFANGYRDDAHFQDYAGLVATVSHPTNALAKIERYLEKGESLDVRLTQVALYRQLKEFESAIKLLAHLRDRQPFEPRIVYALVETYLDAGRYTEARALSQELTQTGTDSAYAHFLRGRSEVGLKWFKESKESFEIASRKAPADAQIRSYLDHVSGMLGEGANTLLKEALPPVKIPEELLAPLPPARLEEDHGAYYERRTTAISFEKGAPLNTTEYLKARLLTPAGVSAMSTFQVAFNPLVEQIYVNRLEVRDSAGDLVSTGRVADYYVLDEPRTGMATERKVVNIPVPGLQLGHSVELMFTRREHSPAKEFPFQNQVLSATVPVRESSIFLRGDTGAVRHASAAGVSMRELEGGLCWQVKDAPTYQWEPFQPPVTQFLPTVWLAEASTTWRSEATNYLASISDRLDLPEPQRETARKLVNGLTNLQAKVKAVSSYVQTNHTYKAIEFGRRARIPQTLEDFSRNRYGDCKDHALLARELLRFAGVPAFLALVNTAGEVRQDVPSLDQFDHMIVFVPDSAGQDRFLDCTDKNGGVEHTSAGLADREAFILDPARPRFVRIPKGADNANLIELRRAVELENGADARVAETISLHGMNASIMRGVLRQQTPDARRSTLVEYLDHPGAELTSFAIDQLEALDLPLVIHVEYTLRNQFYENGMDWIGRLPALLERRFLVTDASNPRRSPFLIRVPIVIESKTILIAPGELKIKSWPKTSEHNDRFTQSVLRSGITGKQLEVSFSSRILPGQFPAGDYPAYAVSLSKSLALLAPKVVLTN